LDIFSKTMILNEHTIAVEDRHCLGVAGSGWPHSKYKGLLPPTTRKRRNISSSSTTSHNHDTNNNNRNLKMKFTLATSLALAAAASAQNALRVGPLSVKILT
jgi:hypothetical protein